MEEHRDAKGHQIEERLAAEEHGEVPALGPGKLPAAGLACGQIAEVIE